VEDEDSRTAAKRAVFCAMWWDDVVDKFEAYLVQTRCQAKEVEAPEDIVESLTTPADDDLPFPKGDHWTYPAGEGPGKGTFKEEWEKCSHLLVATKPERDDSGVLGRVPYGQLLLQTLCRCGTQS
jgi:hypothetical protein